MGTSVIVSITLFVSVAVAAILVTVILFMGTVSLVILPARPFSVGLLFVAMVALPVFCTVFLEMGVWRIAVIVVHDHLITVVEVVIFVTCREK